MPGSGHGVQAYDCRGTFACLTCVPCGSYVQFLSGVREYLGMASGARVHCHGSALTSYFDSTKQIRK